MRGDSQIDGQINKEMQIRKSQQKEIDQAIAVADALFLENQNRDEE